MKYCIIYAMLRPEIQEKISVGLLAFSADGDIFYKYSNKKMSAVKILMSNNSFSNFSEMVENFDKNISVDGVSYLNRYSNNLMSVSRLTNIDVDYNSKNLNRLYSVYVDR